MHLTHLKYTLSHICVMLVWGLYCCLSGGLASSQAQELKPMTLERAGKHLIYTFELVDFDRTQLKDFAKTATFQLLDEEGKVLKKSGMDRSVGNRTLEKKISLKGLAIDGQVQVKTSYLMLDRGNAIRDAFLLGGHKTIDRVDQQFQEQQYEQKKSKLKRKNRNKYPITQKKFPYWVSYVVPLGLTAMGTAFYVSHNNDATKGNNESANRNFKRAWVSWGLAGTFYIGNIAWVAARQKKRSQKYRKIFK